MKKIIFIILLTLPYNTESQWVQYPYVYLGGPLYCVQFVSSTNGFFTGHIGIIPGAYPDILNRTYSSLSSWYSIHTTTTNFYYDFYYYDSSTSFLVGSNRCVLKSELDGQGWLVKYEGQGNFYSVSVPSPYTVYVVGEYPLNIIKSTDGGDNWLAMPPLSLSLKGVYFIDNMTGWVCGVYGDLYKTTNGGNNWINQRQSTSFDLEDIRFINSNTGLVVGSSGIIYKTTNGGTNWISKQSNLTSNINAVCFYPPDLFWAAGDEGKIIKSTDTGETWFIQNTNNSPFSFSDIDAPSRDTAYAVVSEGFTYRTINSGGVTGITPISTEIPNQFSLSQNYPNPFNPNTKIHFAITNKVLQPLVQLKVFDVLGREVVTLVNEELKPGTYEVDFDGSNFSSGIYYYKLSVSTPLDATVYTETKKMVLMK